MSPSNVSTPTDQGGSVPDVSLRPDVAAAERLVADGRLTEAVDALAEANRDQRDPELEIRLRDLRAEAAAALEPGPGRPDWPPVYADPFPDVVGVLPEIDARDLTTDVLGGAVAHHGALLVRGMFGAAQITRTVAAIEQAHQARNDSGEVVGDTGPDRAWYSPLITNHRDEVNRRMVAGQGGTWLADSPASTAQILDELRAAGVTDAIAGHLGERPFFSLQKSTLRRSVPVRKLVAWHQDGSFLDADVRTMNAWVALSACGGAQPTPGLEVIPRRIDRVLPVDGELTKHSISFDLIAELAAETPTIFPEFAPGDGLVFDERFVHRTHLPEGMTEIRYALECWFFAPSHPATGYKPLLV